MRYTEYHAGKAVIKDRKLLPGAMEKLAVYENTGLTPEKITELKEHMNDGWIPVEDRLPEDTESGFYNAVSVTMSNGRVTHGCYRNADREWWVAREDGEFKYTRSDEVIAWRPLPEPYRPKKESEGSRRLREREEFFKG